jgi:Glycosyl hydrolase family 79 C-terminal beta domain
MCAGSRVARREVCHYRQVLGRGSRTALLVRRRTTWLAAAAAVVLAAAAFSARASAQTLPPVPATVAATTTGQPMAASFLGMSLEYQALHVYTGRDPDHVNPVFIQLLRNLAPGQSPIVRIGGNSADYSWWPIRGTLPPGAVRYSLTKGWLRMTKAFAAKAGAKLIMGVNLAGGRPAIAAAEARAFMEGIGTRYIDALEIGNEPDLYNSATWYTDRRGRAFYARPSSYNFSTYLQEVARWRAVLPPVPLVGPALASLTWLTTGLDQFLAAEPGTPMVTAHRYALRACPTPPTSPLFASVPNLLADHSSGGLAAGVAPYVAAAHARGVRFQLDELNSVSCSGKRGVSDTFASALWMLDTLFNMASVGVDGVNIHSLPGARYEPFALSRERGRWQAFVHPAYYAMLMFAQAFPPGAQLLPVTAPTGPVKIWATRSATGRTRVVVINKDTVNPQTVQLAVPGAGGRASLDWLRAPSVIATSGVTLGSQSYGAETRTGLLKPAVTTPIVATGGVYTIELPAASAVMLTQ